MHPQLPSSLTSIDDILGEHPDLEPEDIPAALTMLLKHSPNITTP